MSDAEVTIEELTVGDRPDAWAEAGFSVDPDGTCTIGAVRVRLVGAETGRGILGWKLAGPGLSPTLDQIDGLPTTASTTASTTEQAATATSATAHPNGVAGLDHVVLISSDGERTAAALTGSTGLAVRRVRETTSYGAPMRQWFFRAGPVIIELVAPDDGDGASPTGFFGLAMNVDDIDALPGIYGDALSGPKDAVQPGRRIASLRHKQLHMSVPVAFMTPEPGAAPPN